MRTRRKTSAQSHIPGNSQGCITIAALHRTLPGHYLPAPALPLVTPDAVSFQIVRPPLITLRPTLACLQGGAGGADSGSNNRRANDATHPNIPWPTAPYSATATDTRTAVTHILRGAKREKITPPPHLVLAPPPPKGGVAWKYQKSSL